MRCHEVYKAEQVANYLRFGFDLSLSYNIDQLQEERCLTPVGQSMLLIVVQGFLLGCCAEANQLVTRGIEILELATQLGEKQKYNYTRGFSEGGRSAALAYLRWLRDDAVDKTARAEAGVHLAHYYHRSKTFDRRDANLAAPTLFFLEAYPLAIWMGDQLSRFPKATARPGGLFGNLLRIATAEGQDERLRLKSKLCKRMPLHLFRWLHRGHYNDVAFVLHAIFPRPDGPPSRVIETAWDYPPEIENKDGCWDIKGKG